MDQFDQWQVVPRHVFTPYSRQLISTAFVDDSHVGCLSVTSVYFMYYLLISNLRAQFGLRLCCSFTKFMQCSR